MNTSQSRKGGKNDLAKQAILPHPPRGIHVGSTDRPDWQGCP